MAKITKGNILKLVAHEREYGTYMSLGIIPKRRYDWKVHNDNGYRGRFLDITPQGLATQIHQQRISLEGIDIVFSDPKPKRRNSLVRNLLLSGVEAVDI